LKENVVKPLGTWAREMNPRRDVRGDLQALGRCVVMAGETPS
jgi:hypothetical protein